MHILISDFIIFNKTENSKEYLKALDQFFKNVGGGDDPIKNKDYWKKISRI